MSHPKSPPQVTSGNAGGFYVYFGAILGAAQGALLDVFGMSCAGGTVFGPTLGLVRQFPERVCCPQSNPGRAARRFSKSAGTATLRRFGIWIVAPKLLRSSCIGAFAPAWTRGWIGLSHSSHLAPCIVFRHREGHVRVTRGALHWRGFGGFAKSALSAGSHASSNPRSRVGDGDRACELFSNGFVSGACSASA